MVKRIWERSLIKREQLLACDHCSQKEDIRLRPSFPPAHSCSWTPQGRASTPSDPLGAPLGPRSRGQCPPRTTGRAPSLHASPAGTSTPCGDPGGDLGHEAPGGESSPLCHHGAWDRPAGKAGDLACLHWAGPAGCFSEQKTPFMRVCGASLGRGCWSASVPALHSGGAWGGDAPAGGSGEGKA